MKLKNKMLSASLLALFAFSCSAAEKVRAEKFYQMPDRVILQKNLKFLN